MMTFPGLLSNSEQTLGPLTRHFQQNGIRLLIVDHTEEQANVAKILQLCQRHGSIQLLYYTSVHMRQSAICICTGAHVSSPYIALSAPLMTTPTMVHNHIFPDKHWYSKYHTLNTPRC